MATAKRRRPLLPAVACLGVLAATAHAAVRADTDCAGVAALAPSGTTITATDVVPTAQIGDETLPTYCRVRGVANARVGVGGVAYGIGFELRLPDGWNRRFFFQGGVGTDGAIFDPVGYVRGVGGPSTEGGSALSRRFAVVATDGGHVGLGQEFGLDPQARVDYGSAALEVTTRVAKELVTRYYRRPIKRAYLAGCSNGGRQGMLASQRFPDLFDGIIAGNPAFHLRGVTIAAAWDTIALTAIAPTDGGGQPVLAQALSDDDLALVSTAVLAACDGLDGLVDGLVEAPSACTFDPSTLACAGPKAPGCLSAARVDALARVFAGPHDSAGTPLYARWPWDPGIGSLGWRVWKLGTSQTAVPNSSDITLVLEILRYLYLTPPDPAFDPLAFDFDVDPARMTEGAAIIDAVSTDLTAFRKRRGKIIFYAGLSDAVFSAQDLIGYYERVAAATGGLARTRRFARLFLVPGMNHCVTGPALDRFDPLTPLLGWVEKGRAPRAIVATGDAFPGRSRPLCPFPDESRYRGSGSTDDARRFRCVPPTR